MINRYVFLFCITVFSPWSVAVNKLNVLFITVDDMNRDSVGVYGAKVPGTTPNIDQLAAEGLRFEHAHVTVAICQLTRAVWMTGRYPHNNGALGFDEIRADVPTLPGTLRHNGFYTGVLGKTSHLVPSRENAFEYRRDQRETRWGRSADLYGEFVAEFLQNAKETDRPFFLMVNAHDPHRPFDNRTPAALREPGKAAPKSGKIKYMGDLPAPSRTFLPDEIVVPGFLPDLPEIREEIAMYYSSVRRADDVVGRVLGKLKPGSHDTEHLVSGIDFAPTILDILGINAMEGMDGRSFLPVLNGEGQDDRDFVFTQINAIVSRVDYTMRSIQGKRFGLIWNAWSDGKKEFKNESMSGLTWNAMVDAVETDPAISARVKHFQYRVPLEFYDYEKDADALNNLINDPASQELIQSYRLKLAEFMRTTGDVALSGYN